MDWLHGKRQSHRPSDGIRRVGFRKWYERELLASHAHMALALLSFVAVAASFEAFNGGTASEKLSNALFVVLCCGIGLWALRRYLFLLMRAEEIARQARCADCGEFGRFRVVAQVHEETQVRCTQCEHLWTICT